MRVLLEINDRSIDLGLPSRPANWDGTPFNSEYDLYVMLRDALKAIGYDLDYLAARMNKTNDTATAKDLEDE